MKIDINMIKGLLIALAASFLFACAAEAQQSAKRNHSYFEQKDRVALQISP